MKKSAQYVHTWKYLFSHVAKVDLLCPTKSQILVVFVSSTMFVCLDYGSNIAYALFIK